MFCHREQKGHSKLQEKGKNLKQNIKQINLRNWNKNKKNRKFFERIQMNKDNKILTGMNMKDDFKTDNVPPWTSRQPFEDNKTFFRSYIIWKWWKLMWKMSKIMIVRIRTSEICKEKKEFCFQRTTFNTNIAAVSLFIKEYSKWTKKRQTCPGGFHSIRSMHILISIKKHLLTCRIRYSLQ